MFVLIFSEKCREACFSEVNIASPAWVCGQILSSTNDAHQGEGAVCVTHPLRRTSSGMQLAGVKSAYYYLMSPHQLLMQTWKRSQDKHWDKPSQPLRNGRSFGKKTKRNMKLCQGVYEWAQEILKLEPLPSLRENYQLMSMFQLKTLVFKNGLNSRNYRMNIFFKKVSPSNMVNDKKMHFDVGTSLARASCLIFI